MTKHLKPRHILVGVLALAFILWLTVPGRPMFSPPSSQLSKDYAIGVALSISKATNGTVIIARGESMLPYLGERSIHVSSPADFDLLEGGQIVTYKDENGDLVLHVLIRRIGDEWTARGYNSRWDDPIRVNRENLHGLVHTTIHHR